MNLDKACVIDIETNGLLHHMVDFSSFPYKLRSDASLWCVVITNIGTGESKKAVKEEITLEWMKAALEEFDFIVAHNGVKFDFPALHLFGIFDYSIGYPGKKSYLFGREVTFIDTLIWSRLFNPDRYGGHSLESWGERMDVPKTDFRQVCIDTGYISDKAPKGVEFLNYCVEMLYYCIQDTVTNSALFKILIEEYLSFNGWFAASKLEHKLADLAIRRESLGFYFDKDLALKLLTDLTEKMEDLRNKVEPILPPRLMTETEIKNFTPPKIQFKKDGNPAASLSKFAEKHGSDLNVDADGYYMNYMGEKIYFPRTEPIEKFKPAEIKDLDHIKMFLISLGWVPTEWRERDLTKDSKKQNLSFKKRIEALDRWYKGTVTGKYRNERLEILGFDDFETMYRNLYTRLKDDKPVRVPTSPCIRVGVEKELCPHLTELGSEVSFANDFALYLTYKHRKSSIAGGDIEDIDFDLEYPNTGFLSNYREVDSRIPTPAIEIGASTNRYRHISVANIPRASSVYGKEMRSLFGAGPGFIQFGFDFSSLEARITGHYVYEYDFGPELAEAFIAEKPNDIHSVNSRKLGIPRATVKSLTYALLYGAQVAKLMKMLSMSREEATQLFNDYWDSVPALKALKDDLENFWEANGKTYIRGIDGRKIMTRSKHSLLNALFQSAGVICAKYVTVNMFEELELKGFCIDVFKGEPDVCSMIEYHDEVQILTKSKLLEFSTFSTEEAAESFVSSWSGSQLSSISEGNTWYVTMPNPISEAVDNAIKTVCLNFNLNVPLGFEWVVHKNWYGCH